MITMETTSKHRCRLPWSLDGKKIDTAPFAASFFFLVLAGTSETRQKKSKVTSLTSLAGWVPRGCWLPFYISIHPKTTHLPHNTLTHYLHPLLCISTYNRDTPICFDRIFLRGYYRRDLRKIDTIFVFLLCQFSLAISPCSIKAAGARMAFFLLFFLLVSRQISLQFSIIVLHR